MRRRQKALFAVSMLLGVVVVMGAQKRTLYRDPAGNYEFTLAPGWRLSNVSIPQTAMFDGAEGVANVTFVESTQDVWTVDALMKTHLVELEQQEWIHSATTELESDGRPGRLVSYSPAKGLESGPRTFTGCVVLPKGGVKFTGFVHDPASLKIIERMLRTVKASGATQGP